MMVLMPPSRAEEAWTWLTRFLAVVGFVYLLATVGFRAPMGAYLLLLALFFGPEVIRGQLSINRQSRSEDEPK
jgi:fatty acid desaturase